MYGYSKGEVDDKFKHPQKGIKMNRNTEDIIDPLLLKLVEHYKLIHFNTDILFVNSVVFFLAKSRDIESIYCKAITTKLDKRTINGLKSIILDYERREFMDNCIR